MRERPEPIRAVVMGASWGGLGAFTAVLEALPGGASAPLLLVQHQRADAGDKLVTLLNGRARMPVVMPGDRDLLHAGTVYVAPPGYHMLVDRNEEVCFSMGPAVHYSRPSIDELFLSAGHVYGSALLGILLTGANEDGAAGLRYIRRRGGVTMVQDPEEAEAGAMPRAAISADAATEVVTLDQLARRIRELLFWGDG